MFCSNSLCLILLKQSFSLTLEWGWQLENLVHPSFFSFTFTVLEE